MVACMKHQAVEAGGLSSDCESLFWFCGLIFSKGSLQC